MESMILGIGGALLLVGGLALLTRSENARRRAMLADAIRPRAVKGFDLQGDLLPREETSLGPVRYERIPAGASYQVETRQPRHVHNLETGFLVPLATAAATALCATIATGLLAWAWHWPARTVLIAGGLSLIAAWLWRLGVVDRLTWAAEVWKKQDLDGDGLRGNPATHLAALQPEAARADVARQVRTAATNERLTWLQSFVGRCYAVGCSESAQGIKPGDRARYLEARDLLLRLGLAQWRDAANKRLGWELVADESAAIALIATHVAEL